MVQTAELYITIVTFDLRKGLKIQYNLTDVISDPGKYFIARRYFITDDSLGMRSPQLRKELKQGTETTRNKELKQLRSLIKEKSDLGFFTSCFRKTR